MNVQMWKKSEKKEKKTKNPKKDWMQESQRKNITKKKIFSQNGRSPTTKNGDKSRKKGKKKKKQKTWQESLWRMVDKSAGNHRRWMDR